MTSLPLEAELVKLGMKLKSLRALKGWTLADLAQRVDVSEAYLSRLESGERQASLAVLLSLVKAYDISLSTLFEPQEEAGACTVIRHGRAVKQQGNGLFYKPLTGGGRLVNLHPIQVTVPANRRETGFYEHEGEEWLYVLSGKLGLTFTDEDYILEPGDAAHFDSRKPHRLSAVGEENAEIILVACAPNRSLLESYLNEK
jgi:transcriptional regulator with XRE-family HTH domain